MRTLRREAVRPPLTWSRGGFWCYGGSIPSGVQVFRDSEQSLQHQHKCWSRWEVQSQTEQGSLGKVCRTQRVGLLLFADGTDCEWELFRTIPQEQLHLGIWPEMFKWWVPWTVILGCGNRGLWDPGLKSWVFLTSSRPWEEWGSDDMGVGELAHPSYTQYNCT